jgi:hypothetical protein
MFGWQQVSCVLRNVSKSGACLAVESHSEIHAAATPAGALAKRDFFRARRRVGSAYVHGI